MTQLINHSYCNDCMQPYDHTNERGGGEYNVEAGHHAPGPCVCAPEIFSQFYKSKFAPSKAAPKSAHQGDMQVGCRGEAL